MRAGAEAEVVEVAVGAARGDHRSAGSGFRAGGVLRCRRHSETWIEGEGEGSGSGRRGRGCSPAWSAIAPSPPK